MAKYCTSDATNYFVAVLGGMPISEVPNDYLVHRIGDGKLHRQNVRLREWVQRCYTVYREAVTQSLMNHSRRDR